MTHFARTEDRLDQQLSDGLFTRGAQMTVEIEGARVLDLAIGDNGLGADMTPEHVFRVYCTIKPVTAVAIARLVDDGALELDAPVRPLLPDLDVLGDDVTLAHVLTHTAGLQRPQAVEMELLPAGKRRAAIARTRRPPGWRVGADAAYSEFAGWTVLGMVIESVTGDDLRAHLREHVIDRLGLDATWVGMTDAEYATVMPRLGVSADLRNLGGFPMLIERSQRVCTETNVAHGGYTNARDLARFYGAVLTGCDTDTSGLPSGATLRRFTSAQRPLVYDQVLARECGYGFGFMTDLQQHAFGDRIGPRSFGHSGNVGSSFAFADPDRALAVGVVFNGLVGHETGFLRRRALINALYADLDDVLPVEDSPPAPARRGWRRRRG